MRDKRGVEQIAAFGGYDDIHSARYDYGIT